MATNRNTNFTIDAPFPIDSRMHKANFADLSTIAVRYNRMLVYLDDVDEQWRWFEENIGVNGGWTLVDNSGGGSGDVYWADILGNPIDSTSLISYLGSTYALKVHSHITGDITPVGGQLIWSFENVAPNFILQGSGGSSGNPNAVTYIDLLDTPENYIGQGGSLPSVKITEDGIEFLSYDSTIGGRIRWKGDWVNATYKQNDQILSLPYLGIANKDTSDVFPPQPVEPAVWNMPSSPTWATQTVLGDVATGVDMTFLQIADIEDFRSWILGQTGEKHTISLYIFDSGAFRLLGSQVITNAGVGWVGLDLSDTSLSLSIGDRIRIAVFTHISVGDVETNTNYEWQLMDSTPSFGEASSLGGDLYINVTDDNGTDRTTLFNSIKSNDTVTLIESDSSDRWVQYTATAVGTINGSVYSVPVIVSGIGREVRDGREINLDVIIKSTPVNTDYVEILNYFTSRPNIKGFVTQDVNEVDKLSLTLNENAYGIDILTLLYTSSPDWDYIAIGQGGGGTTGGGSDIEIVDNLTTQDANKALSANQGYVLDQKKADLISTISSIIAGTNITINNADPQNPIVSSIGGTTAGLLTTVYFTGDTTSTTEGIFYLSNITGKGTVATVTQSLSLNDNTKGFFGQDVLGNPSTEQSTASAGTYTGVLSVLVDSNAGEQKYTIEIYLADNQGVVKTSGIPGAPIGDLGVPVIIIMESGIVDTVANNESQIGLTGEVLEAFTFNIGDRVRYHVSAEKSGTVGGSVNFSLFYGFNHNSYIQVPRDVTTDTVINVSTIVGATTTDALEALNTDIGVNTVNISTNTADIATNVTDIATNAAAILTKAGLALNNIFTGNNIFEQIILFELGIDVNGADIIGVNKIFNSVDNTLSLTLSNTEIIFEDLVRPASSTDLGTTTNRFKDLYVDNIIVGESTVATSFVNFLAAGVSGSTYIGIKSGQLVLVHDDIQYMQFDTAHVSFPTLTIANINTVGNTSAVTKEYVDSVSSNQFSNIKEVNTDYTTLLTNNDTIIKLINPASTVTLDSSDKPVGYRQQVLNNTGADVTIVTTDPIIGNNVLLSNGLWAYYVVLDDGSTWGISVSTTVTGGSGGGDVYLAAAQTFTGINTFDQHTVHNEYVQVNQSTSNGLGFGVDLTGTSLNTNEYIRVFESIGSVTGTGGTSVSDISMRVLTENTYNGTSDQIPYGWLSLSRNAEKEIILVAQPATSAASQINSRLQIGYNQATPNLNNTFILSVNGTGNFTGQLTIPAATLGVHALNRDSGDARYLQSTLTQNINVNNFNLRSQLNSSSYLSIENNKVILGLTNEVNMGPPPTIGRVEFSIASNNEITTSYISFGDTVNNIAKVNTGGNSVWQIGFAEVIAPLLTEANIISGGNQSLVTKKYVDDNFGGQGDVYLAATQTFTGVNTFNNHIEVVGETRVLSAVNSTQAAMYFDSGINGIKWDINNILEINSNRVLVNSSLGTYIPSSEFSSDNYVLVLEANLDEYINVPNTLFTDAHLGLGRDSATFGLDMVYPYLGLTLNNNRDVFLTAGRASQSAYSQINSKLQIGYDNSIPDRGIPETLAVNGNVLAKNLVLTSNTSNISSAFVLKLFGVNTENIRLEALNSKFYKDIHPSSSGVIDVGSSSLKFKAGYFSDPVEVGDSVSANQALNENSANNLYLSLSGGTVSGEVIVDATNGIAHIRAALSAVVELPTDESSKIGIRNYCDVTGSTAPNTEDCYADLAFQRSTSQNGTDIIMPYLGMAVDGIRGIYIVPGAAASGYTSQINSKLQVGFPQFIPDLANTHTLAVNGTIQATATYNVSDERLKNIKDRLDDKFISFEYKNEPDKLRYGVIAQEVEIEHPELIEEDGKGMKQVNYIDLLILEIVELKARLKVLENASTK